MRSRLPRLFVALWCFAAATAHLVFVVVASDGAWIGWGEGWSIPFAVGMVGAALASVHAAFARDPRVGDRLFWASLAVAALSVALKDVIAGG